MILFIFQALDALLQLYSLAIVVRAFLSFFGPDLRNPVMRFIFDITEPVLASLRRFTIVGLLDLSPIAAIIILMLLRQLLVSLAMSLR